MRNPILWLTFGLFYLTGLHGAELECRSQIKEVILFLQQAQVTAYAETNITPGNHTIIVNGLSQFIDENSVQVSGDADFTILSVKVTRNFVNQGKKSERLIQLEDSIEYYNNQVTLLTNQQSALNQELSLFTSNTKIGGNNNGVTSAELEKLANLYRMRVPEIHNKLSEISRKTEKIRLRTGLLQQQLNELQVKMNKATADLSIFIKSNTTAKASLGIKYMVSNAGWVPVYDIRSEGTDKPVQIISRANVYQNTGDDWKNVKIALSTGNPSVSNNLPVLLPYRLVYYQEGAQVKRQYSKNMKAPQSLYQMDVQEEPASMAAPEAEQSVRGGRAGRTETFIDGQRIAGNTSQFTANAEGQTNNIFDIQIPYTIPSDGKEYLVEIQKYEVNALYRYAVVPKTEKDAFLIAHLVNWDQTGLLPGDANVFFEGTFVGRTYFDTRVTGDTIPVTLGRDKNIVIERKNVKIFTEKSFNGSSRTAIREYEITIRNKKKTEVTLLVEDQYPLSQNEEITVNLTGAKDAEINKETGALKWNLKLKPSENTTLKFGYEIKYPKKYVISNL